MKAHEKISVAGATGRVGSHLVDLLEERGTTWSRTRSHR